MDTTVKPVFGDFNLDYTGGNCSPYITSVDYCRDRQLVLMDSEWLEKPDSVNIEFPVSQPDFKSATGKLVEPFSVADVPVTVI